LVRRARAADGCDELRPFAHNLGEDAVFDVRSSQRDFDRALEFCQVTFQHRLLWFEHPGDQGAVVGKDDAEARRNDGRRGGAGVEERGVSFHIAAEQAEVVARDFGEGHVADEGGERAMPQEAHRAGRVADAGRRMRILRQLDGDDAVKIEAHS
jgi:hypothetical protein